MAWPRASRLRFWTLVVTVTLGVQAPAAWALGTATGARWLTAALPLALSLPYFLGLQNPFHERVALGMRAVLFPFFSWWVGCLVFVPLWPVAALASTFGLLEAHLATLVTLGVCLAVGVRATVREPRIARRTLSLPGWPTALDGLRIAHLSDLHCGAYAPEARVARWVARTNALAPDLVAVTGDLIAGGSAHVAAVARALGGLRAPLGVWVSLGNHDYFGRVDALVVALEAAGLRVLRNAGLVLAHAGESFWLAGVDDTWADRADVAAALAARPAGAPSVVMAHDPELFEEAAALGATLVLSGHTHGGQVAVPFLARWLTPARVITRFPLGLYRLGASTLYVTTGAGTTGPPVRLGAAPEIALLELRAAWKPAEQEAGDRTLGTGEP